MLKTYHSVSRIFTDIDHSPDQDLIHIKVSGNEQIVINSFPVMDQLQIVDIDDDDDPYGLCKHYNFLLKGKYHGWKIKEVFITNFSMDFVVENKRLDTDHMIMCTTYDKDESSLFSIAVYQGQAEASYGVTASFCRGAISSISERYDNVHIMRYYQKESDDTMIVDTKVSYDL